MAQIDDEDAHCSYAGPGRGDCEHFTGLPGESIPGQHDGPDDTVDVYGKPNGWCWFCWHSLQIQRLRDTVPAECWSGCEIPDCPYTHSSTSVPGVTEAQ